MITNVIVAKQPMIKKMIWLRSNTIFSSTKKKPTRMEWVFRILALQPGLEPGTCGLTVRRSTDWAIGESARILCGKAQRVKSLAWYFYIICFKWFKNKRFSFYWSDLIQSFWFSVERFERFKLRRACMESCFGDILGCRFYVWVNIIYTDRKKPKS